MWLDPFGWVLVLVSVGSVWVVVVLWAVGVEVFAGVLLLLACGWSGLLAKGGALELVLTVLVCWLVCVLCRGCVGVGLGVE